MIYTDKQNQVREALRSLTPNARWSIEGDGTVIWLDTEQTQPTEQEITNEIARLQAEYTAQEYARNRKGEYPDIGDQLDMIWHLIDSGGTLDKTSDFYTSIKVVKDAHPKS